MSTTTTHLTTPPAPWSQLFQSHIAALPSPEFVIASLHPTPQDSNAPTPYLPRLRYCIYRGMWATLPENKHNDAERNPRLYESDMPTFTTDVRMQKVGEFFSSGPGHADKEALVQGSGGGGPVEAVWWNSEVGTQWRVKGTAWVVGNDIDEGEGSGVRSVKAEVGRRMRWVGDKDDEGRQGEWSWKREVRGHFGNCSPGMRGSWRNPSPGTPTHGEGPPDKDHELGQKVTDLDDPIARANFRVVVIKPDEVEQCDISDPAKARRWRYWFAVEKGEGGEEKGEWKREELWP